MITETKKKFAETSLLITLFFACFILCSCNETAPQEPIDKGLINTKQVNMFNDIAMENAIVAQHTLYPYHFIKGNEQLNELGDRDLSILVEHYKKYPGKLNIQQGNTSSGIYYERLMYITQKLENAGIDMAKVSIVDDMSGGSGMSTDDVVEIQEANRKARTDRLEKYPDVSSRSND